jgi:hypothetical protein
MTGAASIKAHIFAAALAALAMAPGICFGQTSGEQGPIKPGSVRVTTRVPEVGKWDVASNPNGSQRVYKCKPLACSDAQTVSFTFQKSPTRHPDPQALEKYAKIELPKRTRALAAALGVLSEGAQKVDTLGSGTAMLKGYPSVFNETQFSQGKASIFVHTAIIFAGAAMIRIDSRSPNRELAKKSLDEFIEAMQIVEGPPLPPGGVPRPPAATTKSL